MDQLINKRLREARKEAGLTQSGLAVLGGVSLNSQARYETTERTPDAKYLSLVWDKIDVPYVLSGIKNNDTENDATHKNDDNEVREKVDKYDVDQLSDFDQVNLYEVKASAGHGSAVISDNFKLLYFRKEWFNTRGLTAKNLVAVNVVGDSMEPDIPDESVVLVDTTQQEIKNGAVYVFTYNDDLLIKRMMATVGGYKAKSINPLYDDMEFDKEEASKLNVVGRAVRALPDIKL